MAEVNKFFSFTSATKNVFQCLYRKISRRCIAPGDFLIKKVTNNQSFPGNLLDPGIGLNYIDAVNFFTLPLLSLRIKGGVNKGLPVLIITGRII